MTVASAYEVENERDKERPRRRPHSGEVGTALSLGSDAPESRMDGSNFRCGARRGAFVRNQASFSRDRTCALKTQLTQPKEELRNAWLGLVRGIRPAP